MLAGFIPALVTFLYTQEWWVLAWFGAPLWFLIITGLRNIPQAILGERRHVEPLLPCAGTIM